MFKIKQLGIDGNVYNWTESWLSKRTQRRVINETASDRPPLTSDAPQGSVLGPILFIIYVNDMDVRLSNFISNFADDAKMVSSIITDRTRMSLQEDLRKISEWSERWEMPFNINKCSILQIDTRNQKFEYDMNGIKLKSVQCVKDFGVTIASASNSSNNEKMPQTKLIECWILLTETSPSRIKI